MAQTKRSPGSASLLEIGLQSALYSSVFGLAASIAAVLFSQYDRSPILLVQGAASYALLGAVLGAIWWAVSAPIRRVLGPQADKAAEVYPIVGVFLTLVLFEGICVAFGRGWVQGNQLSMALTIGGVLGLAAFGVCGLRIGVTLATISPVPFARPSRPGRLILAIAGLGLLTAGSWFAMSSYASENQVDPMSDEARNARLMELARRPNILLIVMDTTRFDYLSCYWDDANPLFPKPTTPNIDRLAAEGVLYKQCVSTAPWTFPSHGSIFTGLAPEQHGALGETAPLHDFNLTLAEMLQAVGYTTLGVSNNQPWIRKDRGMAQGFDHFVETWDPTLMRNQILELGAEAVLDQGAQITERLFRTWLENEHDPNTPFFMFINYMEPHHPYMSLPEYLTPLLPKGFDLAALPPLKKDAKNLVNLLLDMSKEVSSNTSIRYHLARYRSGEIQLPEAYLELIRASYAADIAYTDFRIGQLLKLLESKNELEHTLVVLTADHGENLGEHRLFLHSESVHETLVRVPLILRFPQKTNAGTVIEERVSTLDIYPSITRHVGIGKPRKPIGPVSFPALLRLLNRGQVPERDRTLPLSGRSLLPEDIGSSQDRLFVSGAGSTHMITKPDSFWFSKQYERDNMSEGEDTHLKNTIQYYKTRLRTAVETGRGHTGRAQNARDHLNELNKYYEQWRLWRQYLLTYCQVPHDTDPIKAKQARGNALLSKTRLAGIRGRYKYIWVSEAPDELYDLVVDPMETLNIAEQHPDVCAQMKKALIAWARKTKLAGEPNRRPITGEDNARDALRQLGYL